MNQTQSFIQFLKQKGKSEEVISLASELLESFQKGEENGTEQIDYVKKFAEEQIAGTEKAIDKIIILFWYHNFIQNKVASTYLITLLGTLNVMENQKKRMTELYGKTIAENVFSELEFPTIGSDLGQYPQAINQYLSKMNENLDEKECQNVLAGNHHDIDVKNFAEDKQKFAEASSLEDFLTEKHQRLIATLTWHSETGELWFEQVITPEVVEYVKVHQEIQTGVVAGNRIINQKIPYNPSAWLQETNATMKRYYACHCPFVRESILSGEAVSSLWCYCSGGFTKLFFDYLFDCDLEVELLESVLAGSEVCKFAIKIPDVKKNK
jgi:hypothetical protein